MLKHRQLAGPAVSLLMHFPSLPLEFSTLEVMSALISDGQLATAKAWATELGPETQASIYRLFLRPLDIGHFKGQEIILTEEALGPGSGG